MIDEQEQVPPAWFTALEQRFQVGDRVRVRRNAECPVKMRAEYDGLSGRVVEVGCRWLVGHPIFVMFDEVHWDGGCFVAVTELESLP